MADRTGWFRRHVVAIAATALLAALMVAAPAAPGAADGNEAPAVPEARAITAGGSHSCRLLGSGELKCWGHNNDGQLGQGDRDTVGNDPGEMGANLTPVPLGTGRIAHSISAGALHTCARLDDGSVKCWGDGRYGRLGQGNENDTGELPGEMGDALAPVPLGTGRTATAVTAGDGHTCARLDDASVKCWGYNSRGQLGLGDTDRRGDGPGEMGETPPVDLGTGRNATAVSSGGYHTCAILDNGSVKCWGWNAYGQLGLGFTVDRGAANDMGDDLPAVNLGAGRTATAISAGIYHTCAVLDDATVKCWGAGGSGRLGSGDAFNRGDSPGEMGDNLAPVSLGSGRTATSVTASDRLTCAVLDDASVKCWGYGGDGGLGHGNTINYGADNDMGDILPTVDLGTGRTAVAVTTGNRHVCAILDDATTKCWGYNASGQLGLGDTNSRGDEAGETGDGLDPVEVTGTGIRGSVTVAGGSTTVPGTLVAVLDSNDFSLVVGTTVNGNGDFGISTATGPFYVYVIDPTGVRDPVLFGAPTVIDVLPGATTPVGVELMSARGSISGTVVEEGTGTPIGGARVIALNPNGAPETATVADAAGNYVLADLLPGSHFVAFADATGSHGTRFHPDATNVPAATPVVVTSGGNATADGTLPPQTPTAVGAGLTGTVYQTRPSGTLAGMWVLALHAGDLRLARAGVTDSAGRYTLNVEPGDYKLAFLDPTGRRNMEWHDGQPSYGLGDAASVTAPAVTEASLELHVGGVTGTIRNDSDNQGIYKAWAIGLRSTGTVAAAAITSSSSGSFTINDLPVGAYRLGVVDPATGRIEYWDDTPDYFNSSVFAVAAGQTTNIDVGLPAP